MHKKTMIRFNKTRLQAKSLERALIGKYMQDKDNSEYLRYLIDNIYDDMVSICNCEEGLVLEHVWGDRAWGECDNCGKKYHY